MSVPVKKVRRFLKKQHAEVIAVKKKHIRKGLVAVAKHKQVLAKKLGDWYGDDGSVNPSKAKDSKKWAIATAAALGATTAAALRGGANDAADLAAKHAQQWSDFASDEFDDDFTVSDDDYDIDDDRIDDLQASYVGNTRRGVLSSLLTVASAVGSGMALSDLANSIGADSDDPDDIADQAMSPVASRTEMYIRTETGDTYGLAFANAVSDDETLQKRWATIDPGCEKICGPADGQTQDQDDDFELGDGSTCDYPPAHPNCDCTWLPWRDTWGSMKSTDDIEDDDTAQAA